MTTRSIIPGAAGDWRSPQRRGTAVPKTDRGDSDFPGETCPYGVPISQAASVSVRSSRRPDWDGNRQRPTDTGPSIALPVFRRSLGGPTCTQADRPLAGTGQLYRFGEPSGRVNRLRPDPRSQTRRIMIFPTAGARVPETVGAGLFVPDEQISQVPLWNIGRFPELGRATATIATPSTSRRQPGPLRTPGAGPASGLAPLRQ